MAEVCFQYDDGAVIRDKLNFGQFPIMLKVCVLWVFAFQGYIHIFVYISRKIFVKNSIKKECIVLHLYFYIAKLTCLIVDALGNLRNKQQKEKLEWFLTKPIAFKCLFYIF